MLLDNVCSVSPLATLPVALCQGEEVVPVAGAAPVLEPEHGGGESVSVSLRRAVRLTACSEPRHSNIWSGGPCRAPHQGAANPPAGAGLGLAGRLRDIALWRGSC